MLVSTEETEETWIFEAVLQKFLRFRETLSKASATKWKQSYDKPVLWELMSFRAQCCTEPGYSKNQPIRIDSLFGIVTNWSLAYFAK